MTDSTRAPRGIASRRGRAILATAAAVVILVGAGGWWMARVSGHLLPEGPLLGTHDEVLTAPLQDGNTGMLWGALLLHNGTTQGITIDEVTIADAPGGFRPSGEPYIWDTDRVALLHSGTIAAYPMPLPADWKIPPKHAASGFVIPPHAEADSVEVVYEFPVPEGAVTVSGVTVQYHSAGNSYRKTYNIGLTICPPTELGPCR